MKFIYLNQQERASMANLEKSHFCMTSTFSCSLRYYLVHDKCACEHAFPENATASDLHAYDYVMEQSVKK